MPPFTYHDIHAEFQAACGRIEQIHRIKTLEADAARAVDLETARMYANRKLTSIGSPIRFEERHAVSIVADR